MSLSNRPLEQITLSDLEFLLSNEVPEGRTIEYKAKLPKSNDGDKKEFRRDVISFANADGGDLIFGVETSTHGVPVRIAGLEGIDADAETTRLAGMVSTGINPGIAPAVRFHRVATRDGAIVLIVRVPRSLRGPHMLTFQTASPFVRRSATGKQEMDVDDIRDAFLRASEHPQRVRAFHLQRVEHYETQGFPALFTSVPRIVIHAIPFNAFDQRNVRSPSDLQRFATAIPTYLAPATDDRPNLDGYVRFARYENRVKSLVQVFRNGTIEAVAELPIDMNDSQRILYAGWIDPNLISWVSTVLAELKGDLSAAPLTFLVSLNLLGRARLAFDDRRSAAASGEFDRVKFLLPEAVAEDLSQPANEVLRPTLDGLWNAGGRLRWKSMV